mgnify:FL=1
MLLDRREKHVIREVKSILWTKDQQDKLHKLVGRMNGKEIGITYWSQNTSDVHCVINNNFLILAEGSAFCSKNDKFSCGIGRMVAFAKALVEYSIEQQDLAAVDINYEVLIK